MTLPAELAAKILRLAHAEEFRASKIMLARAQANPKIEFLLSSQVTEVLGKNFVEAVRVKDLKAGTVHAHAAGRWVEICVRDNGIGLDRTEKREIFEQFVRGKAALSGGMPGAGLGLAFVRVIVRAHRGKIDARAIAGGGTEFRLRLRYPRRLRKAAALAGAKS